MQQLKLVLTAVDSTEGEFFLPIRLLKTAPANGYLVIDPRKDNGHLTQRFLTDKADDLVRALRLHTDLQFRLGEYSLRVSVPHSFDLREELLGVFSTIYQVVFRCEVELAVVPRADAFIRSAFTPQPVREEFYLLIDQTVDWMREHERAGLEAIAADVGMILAYVKRKQSKELEVLMSQSPSRPFAG